MNKINEIRNKLIEKGLKATPQRIFVFEALTHLRIHPTADDVYQYVSKKMPSISLGTVYNTLQSFVECGLACMVQTEDGLMRYDHVLDRHHHLYCEKTRRIADFYDDELNSLLDRFFKKKNIPDFDIKDFRLNIIGTFKN